MMQRITPEEFARRHFGEYRIKGNEIQPRLCPFCRGGKKGDKYTFAMNAKTGVFNCKRGKCGVTGTFYKLLLEFGEVNEMPYEYRPQPKKRFKKSTAEIKPLSSTVLEYMKLRGISKETCEAFKIGDDGKGNIVFPFFRDGKQVAVKYRPAREIKPGEQKMWREEGTDTTALFGLIPDPSNEVLVICEGEIDSMAIYEAIGENVVSVPNGSEDFNWVDANWDWLEQFKKIILCGDNDEPGRDMVQSLIPKLGEWRCYVAQLPDDCKDANEVLVKHGKKAIEDIVNNAKEVTISGLLRLADVKMLDLDKIVKVPSGIKGLDKAIGGFMMGQISVWTGVNSSGKSTLLGQLLLESIDNGFSVCAFSGELPAPLFRYWIELQAAGKNNLAHKYDYVSEGNKPYVPVEVSAKIREWYRDRFFLYDNMGAINTEAVMKVFEYAARRYNCKVFLADNLMMLVSGSESEYYRNQSEFIKTAANFCKKFDAHMHIVAHPRKTNGRLTKMDVSGSGDITNLADNVFSVHRMTEEDKTDKDMMKFLDCDNLVDIFKNRFSGRQEITIGLKFDQTCKRFYQPSEPWALNKKYGWEKHAEEAEHGDAWEPYFDEDGNELPF